MEAKIAGVDFKALIAAVTKHPTAGSFMDSDMVNLQVKDGKAIASTFGVVLSKAFVAAEGEIPLLKIDDRSIGPFAKDVCSSKSDVYIEILEKGVKFRTRNRDITTALAEGNTHKITPTNGNGISITEETSKRIGYLSEIAMKDTSRPELCAVLLAEGKAVAANQKSIAVLTCNIQTEKTALPIPLARSLLKGDLIYPGAKETIIKSGIARYAMPAPVKAQAEFPLAFVNKIALVERKTLAKCSGAKLAEALNECSLCLGNISRSEIVVKLDFKEGKLEISALNGGVKFRRVFKVVTTLDGVLKLPLGEAMQALPLLQEKDLTIGIGKNSETFFGFDSGWMLFPSWRKA